ncbi:NAD-dependent epimerase/dehydratase family protein [Dactylosporangium fulvum]|uniref:NAD(P)-dependent oxidoreductase n=1 Tax=Dactylosporangium fulvum TaxID=53359 RepID=A0ABY5WCZ3_9ACTN|nr:NAD(P)-dependent oxidoreductase [Dactylosporangium fulvum]UWP86081.1 NAD(P)-dependent oxidoreductase [Dactylosporangium fulvum]
MEIIGRGFLFRGLSPLAHKHADVVVLAAGVSSTNCRSEDDFRREAELVYDTARRCRADGRRLLFFSSAAVEVYAAPGASGHEDGPVYPLSPYGRHKVAMERVLALSGADHLILRSTYVVGPNQRAHQLLPGIVRQLRSGVVDVYRGATRDLIAVDDLMRVVDSLLDKGVVGTVVNVGCGWSTPATDIVAHLELRLGTSARWRWIDQRANHRYRIDTGRLMSLVPDAAYFGFGPEYYRSVIDRYLEHYQH